MIWSKPFRAMATVSRLIQNGFHAFGRPRCRFGGMYRGPWYVVEMSMIACKVLHLVDMWSP